MWPVLLFQKAVARLAIAAALTVAIWLKEALSVMKKALMNSAIVSSRAREPISLLTSSSS